MTIEQMWQRKKELGYSYEKISELSGLPVSTVQKVLGGYTKSPRYNTIKALEEVFSVQTENRARFLDEEAEYGDGLVKETASYGTQEKKQGQFTLDDYYALPDDVRMELIDGVFYDMVSPSIPHQYFVGEVFACFNDYIKKKEEHSIPFMSGISVELDCDDKTMLQPDIIIVCNRNKIKYRCVYGAPDLVVEILSPSTRKKDGGIKLGKYCNAGVKEYWVVDIERQRVYVYEFEREDADFVAIYTFEDEVPVGIFNGECKVRFGDIYASVEFLFQEER